MPFISDRGKLMPQSPIRKLVPFAEEAKRNGRKVYHLNIGQPDIPTSPIGIEAIKNSVNKVIEYSHSAGNETYRRKLANYYQNLKIDVDYNDILVTTGGSEALQTAIMSCVDYGEEIIVPEPFYANYIGFGTAAGVKIKPVTSVIQNNFALPPIKSIENLITPATKGIIICNPNNPTGYLYSRDELEQLKDIVLKHNLFLISDEVYRELCFDGHKHISVMHLEGIGDHTILIDSISKRYSACGVRIGALISKNKEIINTGLKFGQARLSPPSYGQILGEAALDTPKEYLENVYNEYLARRDFIIGALNKMEGVICPTPKGTFYTIASLPVDDADKFAQWILSDFHYQNQTVMLAPASGFYSTPGLGKNEVRIAFVLNLVDLEQSMKCLEEALKVYPGRTN